MKMISNEETGTVILEPETDKMRITDKGRSFYTSRLEVPKDCVQYYEEVYYNKNLAMEVDEEPSNITLTDDQKDQIRNIQNMMKMLQEQLDEILK